MLLIVIQAVQCRDSKDRTIQKQHHRNPKPYFLANVYICDYDFNKNAGYINVKEWNMYVQFGLFLSCLVSVGPYDVASRPAGTSLTRCLQVRIRNCSHVSKFTESLVGFCLSGRRNETRNALRSFAGKLKGL
jgi:hypothetical protein